MGIVIVVFTAVSLDSLITVLGVYPGTGLSVVTIFFPGDDWDGEYIVVAEMDENEVNKF